MKNKPTRRLRILFDIFYTALPGMGLLFTLDYAFGISWSHSLLLLFSLFFQFLLFWAGKKGIHLQVWGSVVILNLLPALMLIRMGKAPESYYVILGLEAACLVMVFFNRLLRRRLWLKLPVFLLLLGCFLYFGVKGMQVPKWEVCLVLLGILLLLAEMEEKKISNSSAKYGINMLYLFPLFLACILFLLALPVREKPIQWELLKSAAAVVSEKAMAVITGAEYFFSKSKGAYSMSFTGYGPDGALGGSILPVDTPQLTIEGIQTKQTKSPLYLAGSIFSGYTGSGWKMQQEEKPYKGVEYELGYQELMQAFKHSKYSPEEIREITNQRSFQIEYAGLKTESLFLAPYTNRLILPQSVNVLDEAEDSLLLTKARGTGFSYGITFTEINYASDKMIRLMSGQDSIGSGDREEASERRSYIVSNYTKLPASLPGRVKELAASITEGLDNNYDRLKALEAYLHRFPYTTAPKAAPEGQDFTDYFQFERQEGYCTYFATAMAVLARCQGIPTRYVEGFVTDETCYRKNSRVDITGKNAHAWTEAYLDSVGWIPFEPTPGYQKKVNTAWKETPGMQALETPPPTDSAKAGHRDTEKEKKKEAAGHEENIKKVISTAIKAALMVFSFLGCIFLLVLLRRLLARKVYQAKNSEKKLYLLMKRVLQFGTFYSLPMEPGETLTAYQRRINGRLDTGHMRFSEACERYQSVRFGGRPLMVEDIGKMEEYIKCLEKKYRKGLGKMQKIWYWCVR